MWYFLQKDCDAQSRCSISIHFCGLDEKENEQKKMVEMQSMLLTCFSLKSSKLPDTLDFSVLSLTIIRSLMDI